MGGVDGALMSSTQPRRSNKRLAVIMAAAAVGMFGFGFALWPLYDVFCDAFGINGKIGPEAVSLTGYTVDPNREIDIAFDTTVNQEMPWRFEPLIGKIAVHPGETHTVRFRVENPTDRTMVGRAIPSVSPGLAAGYFRKTECFCFTRQTLGPGEVREMPVTFLVDSALPKDLDMLVLSYTFFDVSEVESINSPKISQTSP
jgi:cytochrome c oxidase assembly protein subunit 11